MNIWAIIPARSGSKRLPKKNIKILHDIPLIAWTISGAIASNCFSHIFVSTDSHTIAEIAVRYGAEVPYLRPNFLAEDQSSVVDTIIDILNTINPQQSELPNAIMLLQPTSPFRTVENISKSIHLFTESGGESVISVSEVHKNLEWYRSIDSDGCLCPYPGIYKDSLPMQSFPKAYQLNGMIYLSSVKNIMDNKTLYSKNTCALIIENDIESLDIDTYLDFKIAEAYAGEFLTKNKK